MEKESCNPEESYQHLFDELIHKWEHHGRRLMWDAPKDKSMISATRAMEHDAIIYVNCIRELKEVLKSLQPKLFPPQSQAA